MDKNKSLKKKVVKNLAKNKNLRFGGYAAALSFILIGILLVVNLVFGALDYRIDLTPESILSIGDTTKEFLRDNEDDITIYSLFETGKEDQIVTNILKDYEKENGRIKLVNTDPVLYPGFTESYKKNAEDVIATGSIIVVNDNNKRFKVINPQDMVAMNYFTKKQELNAEQAITSALAYVTTDQLPKVYVLEGHNEKALSPTLQNQMLNQNYEIQQVNLMNMDIEAKDENILVINSPSKDFSDAEMEKLSAYYEKGGRGMVFADFGMPNMTNFNAFLKRMGVAIDNGIIIEGDKSHIMGNYANMLLPIINEHDITNSIIEDKVFVVMTQAPGLSVLDARKREIEITPLLTTSNKSFLKTNMVSQSIEKEDGDLDGPFALALAVEETNYVDNNNITSKFAVFSTSFVMEESFLTATGNLDLLLNSMNYLSDQKNNISIRSKDGQVEDILMDQTKALVLAGFFIIILPLLIIIGGIVVWLRRRHL